MAPWYVQSKGCTNKEPLYSGVEQVQRKASKKTSQSQRFKKSMNTLLTLPFFKNSLILWGGFNKSLTSRSAIDLNVDLAKPFPARSFGAGIVSCCLSVAVIAWIKTLGQGLPLQVMGTDGVWWICWRFD